MSIFGMKIYTVHIKPGDPQAMEYSVFVREGFNFYALLLTFIWSLYHRLWRLSALIIAFNALMLLLEKQQLFQPASIAAMQMAFQLIVGFHANDWRRAGLSKRGYIMADVAAADSLLRAEQRYFERALAAA